MRLKKTPEKSKEPRISPELRNCHECGFESIDDCETKKLHLPALETLPCSACVRNRKANGKIRADFYAEQWTTLADRTPTLQDPDPQEQKLLELLHTVANRR